MRARTAYASAEEGFRQLATIINNIMDGRNGELTLVANETETTVQDSRVGFGSNIILTPMTASAAAALTTTYLEQTDKGLFVIKHGSDAATDRHFRYSIEG